MRKAIKKGNENKPRWKKEIRYKWEIKKNSKEIFGCSSYKNAKATFYSSDGDKSCKWHQHLYAVRRDKRS